MKIEIKEEIEEVTEKTVKAQGHTGRIYLPVSWIGRRVKVLLLKEED